jgi:hypothetical protein
LFVGSRKLGTSRNPAYGSLFVLLLIAEEEAPCCLTPPLFFNFARYISAISWSLIPDHL